MTHFSFSIYKNEYDDGTHAEFQVKDDNYWILKWFYPRKTNGGITIAENGELFDLRDYDLFISRIQNDINCVYRRDNEDIFEYKDNTFRIVPESIQTGLNFDPRIVDFRITDCKEELLFTLRQIYDWLQSVVIDNVMKENNL
jgi:hypothetical protein